MRNKSVESVEKEVDDIAGSDQIKFESIWPILCSYLIIKCHRVVWEKQIQSNSRASFTCEHKLEQKKSKEFQIQHLWSYVRMLIHLGQFLLVHVLSFLVTG